MKISNLQNLKFISWTSKFMCFLSSPQVCNFTFSVSTSTTTTTLRPFLPKWNWPVVIRRLNGRTWVVFSSGRFSEGWDFQPKPVCCSHLPSTPPKPCAPHQTLLRYAWGGRGACVQKWGVEEQKNGGSMKGRGTKVV